MRFRRLTSCVAAVAALQLSASVSNAQKLDPNVLLGLGIEVMRQMDRAQPAPAQPAPVQQQRRATAPVQPRVAAPPVAPAHPPDRVAETQRLLTELGFDPGPIDGDFGPRTARAIRDFESLYGLSQSGVPSPAVVERLREYRAVMAPAVPTFDTGFAAQATMSAPPAASFDCGRAATPTETAICSSHGLADLDVALAAAFSGRLAGYGGAERNLLLAEQRAWLVQRDACAGNVGCLDTSMRQRIAALGGVVPAPGAGQPVLAGQGVGFQAPGAMVPQIVAFGQAGMRSISPLTQDERLITGYPLRQLQRSGPKTQLLGRDLSKADVDLALFIDLALLKAWPQIMEDDETAREYASRFLVGPAPLGFVQDCRGSCGSGPFRGWTGSNEFEREASYRRFVETVAPTLAAAGTDLPLRLRTVTEATIGAYDYERGAFPLRFVHAPHQTSVTGSVNTASGAAITDATTYPDHLPLDREAAQALLASLPPGDERMAFLIVDQTLVPGEWNYIRRSPDLSLAPERMALYADPAGTRRLHEFSLATPEVAPDAPPPGMVEAEIPYSAVVLKLASDEALDPATLQAMVERQIQHDQGGYDEAGLFAQSEVEGRALEFVVPELTGEYRARLATALEAVPTRVRMARSVSLRQVGYQDGALRGKRHDNSYESGLANIGNANPYADAQGRAPDVRNMLGSATLSGLLPAAGLPTSLQASPIRTAELALDRLLEVPPVEIDRAAAEALWIAPQCDMPSMQRAYTSPEEQQAEQAASQACYESSNQYNAALDIRFDLEIEGVESFRRYEGSSPEWIVKAKLLGATVFGTMGEELAYFEAERFPLAAGASEGAPEEMGKVLPEETPIPVAAVAGDADSADVPDAALVERLANADVGGVRLGMSLAEADGLIRSTLDVSHVATLSEASKEDSRRSASQHAPGAEPPYLEYQAYVGADPGQAFVVFAHPEQRDAVLGVARRVTVPGSDVREALFGQLVEKLGPPIKESQNFDGSLVWGARFGEIPGASSEMAYLTGPCRVSLGSDRADLVVEGATDNPTLVPTLSYPSQSLDDPTSWRACGPMVLAQLRYDYDTGTVLTYALVDHAAYAEVYEAIAAASEPEQVAIPKL